MKPNRMLYIFVTVVSFWFGLTTAWAYDLQFRGTINDTSTFDSDEGIVFNNATITKDANINAVSAFEIRFLSGTHITRGARFSAKIKDDDGIDNHCEITYFGNLDLVNESDGDYDGDGLTNAQECLLGYNPNFSNPDNDADGIPDALEIQYFGLDLNNDGGGDADGDGIPYLYEISHNLDSSVNDAADDADGDGISNIVEYQSGCMLPDKADTDGDGLADNMEDTNANGAIDPGETNPCGKLSESFCWSHPKDAADIFSQNGPTAISPKMAINNSGDAILVWKEWLQDEPKIFKKEFHNGAWSTADSLVPFSAAITGAAQATLAGGPDVAMDNNGNIIVAWRQSDGYSNQVFISEYRNGVWKNPSDLSDSISPDGSSVASSPQVAMDNNGNAIIVWLQSNRIYISEYRNGLWRHPVDLSKNINPNGTSAVLARGTGEFNNQSPQLEMSDNGDAIVAWLQSDGSNIQVFKSEYRNGKWHHPVGFLDNISPDGQDAYVVKAAMAANGDAMVVWSQFGGSEPTLFKSEYRDGTWNHPADLFGNCHTFVTGSTPPLIRDTFDIAMAANGDTIMAWTSSVDMDIMYKATSVKQIKIFTSHYKNGSWTYPISIDDGFGPINDPNQTYLLSLIPSSLSLDMDDNGNALLVWHYEGLCITSGAPFCKNTYMFKSELRGGIWWTPDSLEESIDMGDSVGSRVYTAQVAMSNNGNAFIASEQVTADRPQSAIYVSQYLPGMEDADGDGMPYCYEINHNLDPGVNDAAGDLDGDGIANAVEYQSGCLAPDNKDTDGDLLEDGSEDANKNGLVNLGESDPCDPASPLIDTDGDGMPDMYEVAHGLDPLVDDALLDKDEDGLTNFAEYQSGRLEPDDPDTDGDQMKDGWEVAYGLDPLFNDANRDLDDDRITNIEEFLGNSEPNNYYSLPEGCYYFDYDLNGNLTEVY